MIEDTISCYKEQFIGVIVDADLSLINSVPDIITDADNASLNIYPSEGDF